VINFLVHAALIAGGAIVGGKLGEKYLSPSGEVPVWNGALSHDPDAPALVLTQMRREGKKWYRLYAVTGEQTMKVAVCRSYPQAVGRVRQWQSYIENGGTIMAWVTQNEKRAQECDALEATVMGLGPSAATELVTRQVELDDWDDGFTKWP
jgi:hypothetical protein